MGTIAQKLQNVADSKADIAAAITAKGGTVPATLADYGDAIRALPDRSALLKAIVARQSSPTLSITADDLAGVTSIGNYAFHSCDGLTSLTLPNSLTHIGNHAVRACTGLTSVTIPDGVGIIETYAFYGCSGLTSLVFGSGLTAIGNGAFGTCSSCLLFDFRRAAQIPTLNNVAAFVDTNANKKIVVPDSLYSSWIAAANWNSTTNGIRTAITRASDYTE